MRKSLTISIFLLLFSYLGISITIFAQDKIRKEIDEVIELINQKPFWLATFESCVSNVVPNKAKEVNFLEEGCENSPQKCFENCERGDGNSCYSLALLIQIKTDIGNEAANPLFFRACKLGIISGCTNYAAYRLDLESKDEKYSICVADTFEKSCKLKDSWGCTMYGFLLTKGVGRKKNLSQASEYFIKACKVTDLLDESCKRAIELNKEIISTQKSQKNDINKNKKRRTRKN